MIVRNIVNLTNYFGKTMGGYGSGRRFGTNTIEDFRSIDINLWQKEKLLATGLSFNLSWSRQGQTIATINVKIETGKARLSYCFRWKGSEWETLNYSIKFQTTSCNYGGVRYWFTCPALNCGKRVAKLYLGDKYFACRNCYRLAYPCQRETINDRLIRKADKLREKLDWEPGVLNGGGWKPKGMHWKTFWRLKADHDEYANSGMSGFMEILGRRSQKNR